MPNYCWRVSYSIVLLSILLNVQCDGNVEVIEHKNPIHHRIVRATCTDPHMCLSQWGYCGTGPDYCGPGCQAGPCYANNATGPGINITKTQFACVFNTINATIRNKYFNGLAATQWKPLNKNEAAVFLAHVFHETDGLKTMREYCAPGCGPNYSGSWCQIQGKPGKLYYGRGWFQISWPCNYYHAGQYLGVDLLTYPDKVEQQIPLGISTALWFYNTNGMAAPAQIGNFAATTRIINGALECDNGPGYRNQLVRVETYKRVRLCFNLGAPTQNPIC